MAVKLDAQLDVSGVLQALGEVMQGFLAISQQANLNNLVQFDDQMVKAQFEVLRLNLEKALSTGEIDVKKLGFDKLLQYLSSIIKNSAKLTGEEFQNAAVLPIQEGLSAIDKALTDKESRLTEIYGRQKELAPETLKKQAKEETGFTGRVMHGSQKEALEFLKQLKEAEKDDPGGNEKRTKLIEFYTNYTNKLKDAAKETKALKLEESNLQKEKKGLGAERQKLDLKLKQESANIDKKTPDYLVKIMQLTQQVANLQKQLRDIQKTQNTQKKEEIKLIEDGNKANKNEVNTLGQKTVKAFEYYTVLNMLKNVYRESVRTITELDKAMTEAAIVTSMSREEAWKLLGTYQDLASATGLRVSELSGVVNQFLRQGRTLSDALELTKVAAMSAKVAGISAGEAVNYLTSAVNGFGLAATQAEDVADKFAAIAARSASSFEELALAMSKVAPTAQSAGVSIDFMMGVIAKGIETTREAPENIGTAFKTIFARMREVTDIGKATEDGMSLNRVEKALKSIGVSLRDSTGQFRNLEDVLIDVGDQWTTLTSIEQAYIATALAGTRQQPRLLAIFNDFARTKELIQISSEAAGELAFQHFEYMTGMEAAVIRLQNTWQAFITKIADAELIVYTVNFITFALETLTGVVKALSNPFMITLTIITVLSAKLTIMAAKFLLNTSAISANTAAKIINNLATAKGVAANEVLTATNFKGAFSQTVAAKATVATAGAQGAATASTLTFAQAMGVLAGSTWAALSPLLIWIGIVAGVVGAVILIGSAVQDTSVKVDKFANKINKANKELNDLGRKKDDINKLVDRFKELFAITNKSTEQIQELKSVIEELGKVTITIGGKEREFNFITTNLRGEQVFDQEAYDEFLDNFDKYREKVYEDNLNLMRKAIASDGVEAFENRTVLNTAREFGYRSALEFSKGYKDASDEIKEDIEKALMDALKAIDLEAFMKTGYATQDFFFFQLPVKVQMLDEDALAEFTTKITDIYSQIYNDLAIGMDVINEKDLSAKEKAKETLLAGLTAYENAVKLAKQTFTDEAELKVALDVIYASMVDQAILKDLLDNKGMSIDLIATMSLQMDLQAIQNLVQTVNTAINDAMNDLYNIDDANGRLDQIDNYTNLGNQMKADVLSAFEDIFSGTSEGIRDGFDAYATTLNKLVTEGAMTAEEAQALLLAVSAALETMTSGEIGTMMKQNTDLATKLFKLTEEMAKGNFETFAELAQEYGLGAVQAFLDGNDDAISNFFKSQKDSVIAEIDASIAEIDALLEHGGLSKERQASLNEEKAILQQMAEYYEEIAIYSLQRNYNLEQAKSLLEQNNKLIEIETKLLGLGMEPNNEFLSFLKSVRDEFSSIARLQLGEQLLSDMNRLKGMGTMVDGVLTFDPDDLDIGQIRTALENYMSTLSQYIDMRQKEYEEYKKVIDETYKAEIDAVKTAVDEKWKQIDYANKLAEAEEKVLTARRNLAAMQISGVGQSALRQAQKELKKAEEERRKMIEQQMAAEAQKQLETERDNLLQAKQEEMITAIKVYTDQINLVIAEIGEEFIPTLKDVEREFVRMGRSQEDIINKQIDATTNNTEAIIALSEAIQNQSPTTIARGSSFVDTGIFLGIS